MQTVSSDFTTRTSKKVRNLSFSVLASFTKNYDADIDFFTIGVSTIGGTDILKGDNDYLQEWDKFDYADYTDRLISFEFDRTAEPPTSPLTMGIADLVLSNHDNLFTPSNSAGDLYGDLLPKRPVRISMGFRGELIPIFIGLTDGIPMIDEKNGTATFRCVDFLSSILNKTLDQEILITDSRTDEIISTILQSAGLSTNQFDLDTGSVIIKLCYFEKGGRVGDALRKVAQAELGNISMSENGRVRFQNRTNWNSGSSEFEFDRSNTLERRNKGSDTIINVVEVRAKAREEKAKQVIYAKGDSTSLFTDNTDYLAAGETKTIWIDFVDEFGALPITSIDDPEYVTSATTSFFKANTRRDGSGSAISGISVNDTTLFSTSLQIELENTSNVTAVITDLVIYGTPGKVIDEIYVREADSTSVTDFDESEPYKIENDLIQDSVAATSIAKLILADRAEPDDQLEILVIGVPQLQVGDVITNTDEHASEDYFVTRINGILDKRGFQQYLTISKRTINEFFRIGISTIGGTDPLAP